ncbi:MAG: glycosyltransferase family 2 protein [Alphaproteobacteria bacterium]|nr:glycosyltransferase family 2 protein [Alphaproteobacteria bacterium]
MMAALSTVQLSALVVAHNEAAQLVECLDCLTFADELVVVLDACTDESAAIARRYTARLIVGQWPVEGDRRNLGIETCRGEWILEVDADERVTPTLAAEVRRTIATASPGYFLVPFDNYIGARLVRYGWGGSWGVSAAPRLFSRGSKRWGPENIHPTVTLIGSKRRLVSRILHYVDRDISDMLARLDRYSTARAADLVAGGDIGSLASNVRRLVTRFFKCYVQRKGYREGAYGVLIALFAGLYPLLSYLKARLEARPSSPDGAQ